jgi:hypothetical protein
VPAGLRAGGMGELADLDLWLTMTEPDLARLTLIGKKAGRTSQAPLMPLGGLAETGGAVGEIGVAALVPGRAQGRAQRSGPAGPPGPADAARPREQQAALGIVVRGFGPGGAELAGYLAQQVRVWHNLGRPGVADLRLRVYPAEAESGVLAAAAPAQVVLERRHTRLVLDWPAP